MDYDTYCIIYRHSIIRDWRRFKKWLPEITIDEVATASYETYRNL